MPIALPQRKFMRPDVERIPSAEIVTSRIDAKRQLSNRNNTERTPHSVSFSMTVAVRPSLHVNDFTDEEYFSSWYSPEEMEDMKSDIVPTLRMVKNGVTDLPPHMTTRGLEFRTKSGGLQRKANKMAALMGVLDEQERQNKKGLCDPELIRKKYLSSAARACQEEAYARGLDDALDVMPPPTARLPDRNSIGGSRRRLMRIARRIKQ